MIRPTNSTTERLRRDSHAWANRLSDASLTGEAQRQGDAVVITDPRRSITYAELERDVAAFAGALREIGVERGDAVAWQLPNWIEGVVVHLAIIRLGAVSTPIVPIYRATEVGFVLRQSKAKAIVVADTFRNFDYPAMLAEIRDDLPDLAQVVVVGTPTIEGDVGFDQTLGAAPAEPEPAREPDDAILLLYTSGTTAAPKGAIHTHNTLEYELQSIVDLYDLTGADSIFMPTPITHVSGILYGIHLLTEIGGRAVFLDIWSPTRAIELLEEHRLTFMAGATPFLHGIINHPDFEKHDLSALRVYPCGGADVTPALMTQAREALDCVVARMYGSTEMPSLTCCGTEDPVEKWATTDGRLLAGAEMRLVDDEEAEVPTGTVGEILARGPELFVGYLDSDANEAAFIDGGWFKTGDLGFVDADGYLTITGRKKDIILRGGENISAKEIEEYLVEHPKVAEVAAVGMPDPIMVEKVCVYVVPAANSGIELSELVDFLRAHRVANQKLPERLELIDELPRTASGKVKKFVLRERIREQLATPT